MKQSDGTELLRVWFVLDDWLPVFFSFPEDTFFVLAS